MEKLDNIDRKLLAALQKDASLPLEELGQKVGLSRNACWRRIRALEQQGVILSRVALVNPEKIGLGLTVFIQVRTHNHDPAWLDRFAKSVRDMPEILGAYRMTGDLDYLIRARVKDMQAYDQLYRRLITRVDMSDVSASFVMEQLKDTTELPVF